MSGLEVDAENPPPDREMAEEETEAEAMPVWESFLGINQQWGEPLRELVDLPMWVLEHQVFSWGQWEHTPDPVGEEEWYAWGLSKVGMDQDPPPFQAFSSREPRLKHAVPRPCRSIVHPEDGGRSAYGPVIDERTDSHGWLHGTTAVHLDEAREGGRASARLRDRYRRRWWRRGAMPLRLDLDDEAEQLWSDDRDRAFDSIRSVLGSVLGKRSLTEIPLDPVATMRRCMRDTEMYEELCLRLKPWEDVEAAGALCVASFYARAAYGYAARTGSIDTAVNGAMAFSVQKAVFDVAQDVDDASNA